MSGSVFVDLFEEHGFTCSFTGYQIIIHELGDAGPAELHGILTSINERMKRYKRRLRESATEYASLPDFDQAMAREDRTEAYRTMSAEQLKSREAELRREIQRDYCRLFVKIGRRDGFACRCCGNASPDLQIDHVIGIARGGDNDDMNLQLLCRACNIRKGDRPMAVIQLAQNAT